jgi:prepilin-type N-terminal cleavage/methylation domain-containing protein
MRRTGFTMIEIAVVLLILAIAAAAVALNVRPTMQSLRWEEARARIVAFDRLTRWQAREHDAELRVLVDLDEAALARVTPTDEENPAGAPMALGDGCRVLALWVSGTRARGGQGSIAFSRHGLSPSYALQLQTGDGRQRWLCMAGLTGQPIDVEEESKLAEIFEKVGCGPDAG